MPDTTEHPASATVGGKPVKPLGRKSYGSIPHLPGSRVGPMDWHIHTGAARIACEKLRDGRDKVFCTEKLDGSNVSIARIDDEIVALMRSGHRASDSRFLQHIYFDQWVRKRAGRFLDLLRDGERVAGEWLLQAHGTRYRINDPDRLFVAFDILTVATRLPYDAFLRRCDISGIPTARMLAVGQPCSIDQAMEALGEYGHHGALDQAEGAVWRVERDGVLDFVCKYVRHGKVDGRFLPELGGEQLIWNLPPEQL